MSREASPARKQWLAGFGNVPAAKGMPRFFTAGAALIYALYVAKAVHEYSSGAKAVAGYAILVVFAVGYLLALRQVSRADPVRFWALFVAMTLLFIAELPFAQAEAFELAIYLTILSVAWLGTRATPIVIVLALGALVLPASYPPWGDSLATGLDNSLVIGIPVVAVTVYGIIRWHVTSQALTDARAQLARLDERARIARDMHDLLGHSLTTITVKAGLANRLGESDPARARQEMTEVESIARSSLADVRAAVSSFNVTLAGEIAAGRELLRAAGINAELPGAVDVVDPAHQELFGWVVREGLTNVVRHAHATSCAIRLSPTSVEVVDDGVGAQQEPASRGNGLSGLRERVAAAGGTVDVGAVDAGPGEPGGWRLRVSLPPLAGM